jgi:hypothetical protein
MKLLLKIRLSHYFFILLIIFMVLAFTLQTKNFTSSALTLFSVNSFLYGFYIAPILSGQKARIDELQKIIRAEANALFSMMLKTKKLQPDLRTTYQALIEDYIKMSLKQRRAGEGEREYEALITKSLEYKGNESDKVEKILEAIVANQQNRSALAMQLKNKVYSNEWWVMFVLFSITLGFILYLDIGSSWQMRFVKAFLCTGLTMLIVILVKLSTLTHKKAKELWKPLERLVQTRFYRID